MKIAVKVFILVFAGVFFSSSSFAEGVLPETTTSVQIDNKQKTASTAADEKANLSSSETLNPPNLKENKSKEKEELTSPEIPDSVKGVIKRLNKTTDNVTLDDLNSAREAVAKLDILIDIEKRLTDLSKLRQDREGMSLSKAIPINALGPNASIQPPEYYSPVTQNVAQLPIIPTYSNIEVQRIVGAGGKYSALVKADNNDPVFVREGEKLPDGSVVQNISKHGVTVLKGNNKHTYQVTKVIAASNGM